MKRILIAFTAAAMLLIPVQAQALNTDELLSVIAMPLAVAAVSNITGVPVDQLSNFVATLNNANVPAVQVVELIRYVPVALVEDATNQQQPVFVDYVQTQVSQGVTGVALVPVIVERLRTYDIQPEIITVTTTQAAPVRTIIVDDTFIPTVVRTRVETIRTHPHGGPPGQLKKAAGVQTGAEIVHGGKPGRTIEVERRGNQPSFDGGPAKQKGGKHKTPQPMMSSTPSKPMPPGQVKKMEQHGGKPGEKGHDKKH